MAPPEARKSWKRPKASCHWAFFWSTLMAIPRCLVNSHSLDIETLGIPPASPLWKCCIWKTGLVLVQHWNFDVYECIKYKHSTCVSLKSKNQRKGLLLNCTLVGFHEHRPLLVLPRHCMRHRSVAFATRVEPGTGCQLHLGQELIHKNMWPYVYYFFNKSIYSSLCTLCAHIMLAYASCIWKIHLSCGQLQILRLLNRALRPHGSIFFLRDGAMAVDGYTLVMFP